MSASQPPAGPGSSFFPTATPTSTGATAGATPTAGTASVTVRGPVEQGVEPGCVLLKAEDGQAYLLVGGDRAVIGAGGRLEVIGQPKPDLMTTCQQGTPFQVEQVRRI